MDPFTPLKIPVFPLAPGSKEPEYGCEWTKYTPGGHVIKGNYGVAIPLGYVVVDADTYKKGGPESLVRLKLMGLPPTFTVQSGRGGLHHWYTLPDDIKLKKQLESLPGIDILTKGMYVVGPGSVVKDKETGELGPYTILETGVALKDVPALPNAIVELYEKAYLPVAPPAGNREPLEFVIEDYDRYCVFLQHSEGGTLNAGCNDYTYQIAARGRDFGLPLASTYKAMVEHWNERCNPPWPEAKLYVMVEHAYSYGTAEIGKESVAPTLFEQVEEYGELPENSNAPGAMPITALKTNTSGSLTSEISNLIWLLQNDMDKHEVFFKGLFRYDENAHRISYSRRPFFRPFTSPTEAYNDHDDGYLTDDDVVLIRVLLAQKFLVDFSKDAIRDVILSEAKKQKFHPVRDWLSSLEWDGKERAQHLFTTYFNLPKKVIYDVPEIAYRQKMAKAFILAAIYRIFNPGYKWDYMLTLTGPEGTGKSTFAEEIGRPWTTTAYALNTDKKTLQCLDGVWIVEFPEMSATRKTDFDQVKAFLSSTSDTYIPMYGREPVTRKRQCMFIWSLNPQSIGGVQQGFLRDQGQNRRFHIIDVPVYINLEGIKKDRAQIFAEAMSWYRQGVQPYTFVAEAGGYLANKQTSARTPEEIDPWEEVIENYTDGVKEKLEWGFDLYWWVSYDEIYELLGIYMTKDRDKKCSDRIRRILLGIGWEVHRTHVRRGFRKMIPKELQEKNVQARNEKNVFESLVESLKEFEV